MFTEDSESSDEDDEEIDVVSIEHEVSRRRSTTQYSYKKKQPSSPVSMSAQVAAMHNYSSLQAAPLKLRVYSALHTSSSRQHMPSQTVLASTRRIYHASSPASPHVTSSKRQNDSRISWKLKRVAHKLNKLQPNSSNPSSHSNSDSEDNEGKRAQHNVLERKRRDDLKSSFQRLREQVPDIASQERAPKVVILKKATDYIAQLLQNCRSMEAERENQLRQRKRLERNIEDLKRELL